MPRGCVLQHIKSGVLGTSTNTKSRFSLACRRTTCRMSPSSDKTSSELTRVPASSELHTIVTAKSSHFFTFSDFSSDDDESASKLRYTDGIDVWSIEQRESSPPRGLIWLRAGDAGDSDATCSLSGNPSDAMSRTLKTPKQPQIIRITITLGINKYPSMHNVRHEEQMSGVFRPTVVRQ